MPRTRTGWIPGPVPVWARPTARLWTIRYRGMPQHYPQQDDGHQEQQVADDYALRGQYIAKSRRLYLSCISASTWLDAR